MKKKKIIKQLEAELEDDRQRFENIITLAHKLQDKLLLNNIEYAEFLSYQIIKETGF